MGGQDGDDDLCHGGHVGHHRAPFGDHLGGPFGGTRLGNVLAKQCTDPVARHARGQEQFSTVNIGWGADGAPRVHMCACTDRLAVASYLPAGLALLARGLDQCETWGRGGVVSLINRSIAASEQVERCTQRRVRLAPRPPPGSNCRR